MCHGHLLSQVSCPHRRNSGRVRRPKADPVRPFANQNNLLDQENITTEIKGIKQEQQIETKYCFDNIKIKWIKELGRTDPSGASLFLNPRVPLFFRIFIPFAILFTVALFFVSQFSNTDWAPGAASKNNFDAL